MRRASAWRESNEQKTSNWLIEKKTKREDWGRKEAKPLATEARFLSWLVIIASGICGPKCIADEKKRNTFQVTYRRQKPSPGASSCICWVTSSFSVVPPDNNSVLDPVIKERAGRSMRRVIRDRIYSYSIVRAGVPTLVIFVQQKSCVWGMQKRSGKKVHSVRHAILILHV